MERKRLELISISIFFAGLSILTFFVFQAFLHILVLAAVLAILLYPLHHKLSAFLHKDKAASAVVLVLLTLFFIVVPVLFFGWEILAQVQNFFSLTSTGQGQYMQAIQEHVNLFTQSIVFGVSFNVSAMLSRTLSFISDNLGAFLSQTTYIFFQTFLLLFALFFFLRDGESMLESVKALSPFEKEQNEKIMHSLYWTVTSVIRGTLVVALIRLVLFTCAFYIFGIPNALLWGSVGGIVGSIPGLGTPFVAILAFIYLLFYGNSIISAVAMGIFGILVLVFVDNMLSAYFFGRNSDVPSFLILFSILGGIFFFGPLGFIFGPLVLSLFISAVDMYKSMVLKK